MPDTSNSVSVYGHREVLLLCAIALVAAPLLSVSPGDRVGARWMPDLLMPPMCMSRAVYDIDCPGCGLTRSFVHLAHGDWRSSFQSHRLGWLVMALAVFQIPYRAHLLWGSRRFAIPKPMGNAIIILLILLLVVNWGLKMLGY